MLFCFLEYGYICVLHSIFFKMFVSEIIYFIHRIVVIVPQAAQTLFVIYIRDSIALRFDPFRKRMYENGLKIALNST